MRLPAALLICLLPACAGAAPAIVGVSKLSSAPVRYSQGAGGPVNRLAFDLKDFDASQPGSAVTCRYASGLRYGCKVVTQPGSGRTRRLVVDIPDLNLGAEVTVRFSSADGMVEHRVELANPPQTVHEIESLQLPDGGATTTGPDGARARVTTLLSWQTTTSPAMLLDLHHQPDRCDVIYAQWVAASATDPVFSSEFGALNGAVAELRPVAKHSPLRADNLPGWLITYMASARRVQFIAHYEVIYKVGVCADRIVR